MATHINLGSFDKTWWDDAILGRESGGSNVICVRTSDARRLDQLVHLLASDRTRQPNLFSFHPWEGLRKHQSGGLFQPFSEATTGPYAGTISSANANANTLSDVSEALRIMGGRLERTPNTTLIIRGLQTLHDPTGRLSAALDSWASDPVIRSNQGLIVILAADPESALKSTALDRTINTTPPRATLGERRSLVETAHAQDHLPLDENAGGRLATILAGLDLHQSATALTKVVRRDRVITADALKREKSSTVSRSSLIDIIEPGAGFEAIGGYEEVKRLARERFIDVFTNLEGCRKARVSPPRGLLMYGPPGTGKSLFARSLAAECALPFIALRTENLFGMYLGESGARTREAIQLLEQNAPCIAFIDEIDRFGQRVNSGGDGASQETRRVFSQFLEWLGDPARQTIILGATNVLEHLDKAFIRPGRFDIKLPFGLPDPAARMQILRIHLGLGDPEDDTKRPDMDRSAVLAELPHIVEQTVNCSGADLAAIVMEAKYAFFHSKEELMSAAHLQAGLHEFLKSNLPVTDA